MSCSEMKAYFRREERYEGLQIVFWNAETNRPKVLEVIEHAKVEFGLAPDVFENCYPDEPGKCAYYIEFSDDYDRDAEQFFESILEKLGIAHCD